MAKKKRASGRQVNARTGPRGRCLPRHGSRKSSDGRGTSSSLYGRYKKATQSFRENLAALLPSSIPLLSVSDLGNSAEYLLDEMTNQIPPPTDPVVTQTLLSHLDESIKLREKFTSVFSDDDEGHAYMVGMLRYCRWVLRKCRRICVGSIPKKPKEAAPISKSREKCENIAANYFEALNFNDDTDDDDSDDEEEDDNENTKSSGQTVRPKDPLRPYSIQKDLIDGSDKTRARIYMFQVEMLFEMVDYHYRFLKSSLREIDEKEVHSSHVDTIIVVCTLKAAAASNMALEEIKYLEESMKAESPQFKTHYHIIAVLIFGALVDQIDTIVHPKVMAVNPNFGLDFVAKEVECGFRTPMDPGWYNSGDRVKTFLKKGKVANTPATKGIISGVSRIVPALTFLEVGIDFAVNHAKLKDVVADCRAVRAMYCENTSITLAQLATTWHAVGKGSLGGKRSITHTQSMLQSQTYALRSLNAGRKTIRWDAMGPDWDEDTNPADGTADARMDDFYYRTFYQQWFSHTRFGADKYKLIFQDALPRIFPLLQGFLDTLDRRDADIPLSYSIAVHAMLTAIICVQGNGDVKRIASVSKRATQTFNHQISGLIDCKVVDMTDNIDCVLKKVKMFEEVTKPTLNHIHSAPADLLGSWNPLVAGSLLMQTSYMNSMRFGIPAMNTNNQAVSTMHILNALSVRKLIDVNKIPLMDILDTALEGSKPIWGDGKPPLGSFTKYFFISIGTSLSASATISKFVTSMPWHQFKRFQTEMSEDKRAEMEGLLARQIELEDNLDVVRLKILMGMRETFKRGSRMEKRYLTPSDISLSYRFCVERNFSGNVENVSSGNCIDAMSTAGTYATLMNYYERYKALDNQIPMDAMKMAINFPKLSWVLADFMSKLDEAMGWNDIIVEVIKGPLSDWKASNKVKRQYVLLNLIGDRILGELDSDLHSDLCTESKKCASFMKGYFEAFEKMDIALF